MAETDDRSKPRIERIGRYLYRMTPIMDEDGEMMDHIAVPFRVEVHPRDIMQIAAGASLLGLPMVFTGEVWQLGGELPMLNIITLALLSTLVVTLFVYFNVYRDHLREHLSGFIQRIVATMLISFLIAALLLTLLDQAPWRGDWLLALKRVLIVMFPSSMGAAFGDNLS